MMVLGFASMTFLGMMILAGIQHAPFLPSTEHAFFLPLAAALAVSFAMGAVLSGALAWALGLLRVGEIDLYEARNRLRSDGVRVRGLRRRRPKDAVGPVEIEY